MPSTRLGASLALLVGLVLCLLAAPVAAQELLAQEGGELVRGTLRGGEENEPLPGVEITVSTADGEEIATATTGDDGKWEVELPGPGDYSAQLDESTLPEGVSLTDPERNPLTVEVRPGQKRTLIFQLGEGGTGRRGFGQAFAQSTANGVKFGLIIGMAAIGLSLIFGTTGLVNFAHGELVTFGAVLAWFLNAPDRGGVGWLAALVFGLFLAPAALSLADGRPSLQRRSTATSAVVLTAGWAVAWAVLTFMPGGLQVVLAAIVAVAISLALGAGLERGLWQPLRRRRTGLIQMLVISIGLSLVLRNFLQIWFGGRSRPFFDYTIQDAISFGPFRYTPREIGIIVVALVVLIGVGLMLQRTRIGKAMRAVADNRDLAESSGIDVQRVILVVWMLGAALASLGGVLNGLDQNVSFLLGFRLLLLIFAGVILGGLGTAFGALVGSLVVGLVTEWSTLWFSPELKFVWALGVLIVILLFRPQGILGKRERIG